MLSQDRKLFCFQGNLQEWKFVGGSGSREFTLEAQVLVKRATDWKKSKLKSVREPRSENQNQKFDPEWASGFCVPEKPMFPSHFVSHYIW